MTWRYAFNNTGFNRHTPNAFFLTFLLFGDRLTKDCVSEQFKYRFMIMQIDSESRAKFERARDTLVAEYIYHPDVTLIDIGYPLADDRETKELVLRIHVRSRWIQSNPDQRGNFPEEVNGIPVIVMSGDYRLE